MYKLITMHVCLLSTAVFLICYHVHTLQVSTLCYHSSACRYKICTMYVPGKYTHCKIKCYQVFSLVNNMMYCSNVVCGLLGTKPALKEAYATSYAKGGIYKNKLDQKICMHANSDPCVQTLFTQVRKLMK